MSNNFNLQKYLIENKLTTNSKLLSEIKIEPETDTGKGRPYTEAVYEFEKEVSGEENAEEFYEEIAALKTIADIKNYYLYDRGWAKSKTYTARLNKLLQDLEDQGLHAYTEPDSSAGSKDFTIELLVPKVYFDVDTGEFASTMHDLSGEDIVSFTTGGELSEVIFSNDYMSAQEAAEEYPGLFKVTKKLEEIVLEPEYGYTGKRGGQVLLVTVGYMHDIEEIELDDLEGLSFEDYCEGVSGRVQEEATMYDDRDDYDDEDEDADDEDDDDMYAGDMAFDSDKTICHIDKGDEHGTYISVVDLSRLPTEDRERLLYLASLDPDNGGEGYTSAELDELYNLVN